MNKDGRNAPRTEPRRSSDNREYLKKILALLDRMGLVPLVRDASHLGFPTYFILVPGISEMFEMSSLRLRDLQTNAKVKKFFEHFPDLDEEEEELLLRLIQFKEGSIIENGLDLISGKFLKGELFTAERVGAYLALKKGKYTVAGYLFRKAFSVCQDKEDRKHLACMSEYARYMEAGAPRQDALAALTFLFGKDLANKAADETKDMAAMMQKVFPRLRCYDCGNCPLAGVHCEYPEAAVILRKINRALDQSTVTQEELLAKLRELV